MKYPSIDRRKTFYCGPEHKVISALENLGYCLKDADSLAQCVAESLRREAEDINMLNYGGKVVVFKDIAERAKHLRVLIANAKAELDKFTMQQIESDVINLSKTGG